MASIDITTQSGAVGNGDLQLQNGAPMDATLRFVTDAVNTASPLKLSTSLVQTTSTLKITTNDNPYIDAEDGSGNNRFTVGRAPASQQVNVDFASNPAGSTTAVGAIRTFRDGTNLSEAMTFIEDGSVGIGTTAPVGLLDLYKAAAATRLAIRGDAGQNRLISYRTGAVQRFGLYVNNTAESGSNVGSDFAIRAYSDAGTLLSTPLFIQRSTANVGIGTTSPNIYSTLGATNIVSIQATGTDAGALLDIAGTGTGFSGINMGNATIRRAFVGTVNGSSFGIYTNPTNTGTAVTERLTITSAGNVGIGTTTPTTTLDVSGTLRVTGNSTLANLDLLDTQPSLDFVFSGNTAFKHTIIGENYASSPLSSNYMTFKVANGANTQVDVMTLNGVGNVGIGTSSPFQKLSLGTPNTGATEVQSYNTTDQFCFNFGYVPAGLFPRMNDIIACGSADGTNGASNIRFFTNPVSSVNANEKMRITGDGYLRLSTNSGGIQFNGDTAAANALDDYEEGTWTPGVAFGGGSTGVVYSLNTGTYTKIGRQVTVNGYIVLTSKGSSTGSAQITGLPFTIPSNNANYSAPSFRFSNITFSGQFVGYGDINTTNIDLNQVTLLGALTAITDTNFANNSNIIVTLTYFV